MLFAQARGGTTSNGDEVVLIVLVVCGIITFAASLAIQILFLLTLKRALEQCSPHTRTMEPGMVFLNLIPCFGSVWMFITVSRLSESLRAEYDDRGMDAYGDYGQQIGISYAALVLGGIIPYVGVLFAIGGLVCWILYWVKMAELSRGLREGESFREERDDYRRRRREERDRDDRDDEYDDRPSRRRGDDYDRDDDSDDRSRRRSD